MPHKRPRHCMNNFRRKLAFSPVVTIQGPRQCGKSFFVRELVASTESGVEYVTFDHKITREFAAQSPDTFLEQKFDAKTLAIDEAQKVPDIFDAVKYQVDKERRPGRYILLGSTEFSREFLIRESMTGRISRTRVYPLNAAEALELPPNPIRDLLGLNVKPRVERRDLLRHLEHGGFPGIFAVRSKSERADLLNEWISTTSERDIHQFPRIKADSELTMDILRAIATMEEPEAGRIAKMIRRPPRRVEQHLNLLEQIFVIHHVPPLAFSTGKNRYYLCDAGVARVLGASFETQLLTQVILERLSQVHYDTGFSPRLSYYRSQKGAVTHLVEENDHGIAALLILSDDRMDVQKIKRLQAFCAKAAEYYDEHKIKRTIHAKVLAAVEQPINIEGFDVLPWEAIV